MGMAGREIDISCRRKDYTMEVSVCRLPVDDEKMSAILSFLDLVKVRKDVSVVIRIEDEEYEDDVPNSILLANSQEGFYMELSYSMDNWEWSHPLILANDHLDGDEAASVLTSIFHECTDQIPIVANSFGEISSKVYPEEGICLD